MVCIGVVLIVTATMPGASAAGNGNLGFTVTPAAGPPGTLVHFAGTVPADMPDYIHNLFGYGLEGNGLNDCELILPMENTTATVTGGNFVTGSFVVGAVGGCFMSPTDRGPQAAVPGVYLILLSCHACGAIGTFTITSGGLPLTGSASVSLAAGGLGLLGIGLLLAAASRRFAGRLSR